MTKAAKKSVAFLLACLGLLAVCASPAGAAIDPPFPPASGQGMPYALSAAFYRANDEQARRLPVPADGSREAMGSLFLAVTARPENPDVYLYGSKSQTQGKVTEVAVSLGTIPLATWAVFPKGVARPDPLRPGEMTVVLEGTLTVLVPLPPNLPGGGILHVRLSGLACSPVNCTPLTLATQAAVPDEGARANLPEADAAPWWGALLAGVAEPLGTAAQPAAGTRRFGTVPLRPGSAPAVVPLPERSGAFLEKIRPLPFTPGLEVASMGKAVILGFLAGVLLNLMPCVLPVLGIKLAALLRNGDGSHACLGRFRRHQLFFAMGILAWFTVMAGLFYYLDLAWGQIFQSPAVVLGLAVLLLLLALNLFGVLSLPLIDFRSGTHKNPDVEAFASGFAATLLATPCGGPLLGGVLSWALMQPLGVLALTLESVGLGMAFPYLLLAAFPSLSARLPRPGNWMGVLEHVLGFLLLATVAYLVSFLPAGMLPRVIAALVLTAFGGWMWGKGAYLDTAKRWGLRLLAAACIGVACVWPLTERATSAVWTAYSHKALEEDLGKRLVLVDFTADWCPTCKVVEATALADDTVLAWKKRYDLVLLKVDMTRENPEGEALLRAVGSVSIPVIAIFGPGKEAYSPLVLRDVVTRGQIAEALKLASEGLARKEG